MTLNTILRFSRATTPEEMFTGQWQSRATKLNAYKPYIDQRRQEGCANAWKLREGIKEQGYPRGYASIRDYVSRTPRGKPHRSTPDRQLPRTDSTPEHVRFFAHMLAHLQGDRIHEWNEAASATTELPGLRHFDQHLLRDLDAVTAGLTLP